MSAFVALANLAWAGAVSTVQYNFTGVCSDCTGNGTGVLTLLDTYVPGTQIGPSFQSFTYSSNLVPSFSITSGDPNLFIQNSNPYSIIPSNLPGFANVFFCGGTGQEIHCFQSTTGSPGTNWSVCVGPNQCEDFGTNGTWSAAVAGVPEPATAVLVGLPIALLGYARKRRARVLGNLIR